MIYCFFFFFSSRRRHTRFSRDWSSDVCSSDLLDLIENVASGLHMTPAERSALHVLSRGQDPPMPPATPGGERPEIGPGQRELIARLDAPAAITDETWTLVIRNKALTAWTGGWFDRVPLRKQNLVLFLFTPAAERLLP